MNARLGIALLEWESLHEHVKPALPGSATVDGDHSRSVTGRRMSMASDEDSEGGTRTRRMEVVLEDHAVPPLVPAFLHERVLRRRREQPALLETVHLQRAF
jgi:hypothetical protein